MNWIQRLTYILTGKRIGQCGEQDVLRIVQAHLGQVPRRVEYKGQNDEDRVRYEVNTDDLDYVIYFIQNDVFIRTIMKQGVDDKYRRLMLECVNRFNGSWGRCRFSFEILTNDKGENMMYFQTLDHINLVSDEETVTADVTNYLSEVHTLMTEHMTKCMREWIEGWKNEDENLQDDVFVDYMRHLNNQMDEHRQRLMPDNMGELSVANLLNFMDASSLPEKMVIASGSDILQIEDTGEIASFDFRKYLAEAEQKPDDVVATVTMPEGTVVMFFSRRGGNDGKTLYYTLKASTSVATMQPIETLVEVRQGGEKGDYWELKYMLDDARDKMAAGKSQELTPQQQMGMAIGDGQDDISGSMYWGRRLYTCQCYAQALYFFSQALRQIEALGPTASERAREVYRSVQYYIGTIYRLMGQEERAHYYLVSGYDVSNFYSMKHYLYNMEALHSPSTIGYIHDMLNKLHIAITDLRLKEQNGEGDGDISSLMEYQTFFNHHLASEYVAHGRLDDAEQLLKDMIVEDTDAEFAKQLLAEVQRKKAEADKEENNE